MHFSVKEGGLKTCCQVVNQALETYATDYITLETDSEIAH